jgi:hypothetical protein
VTYRIGPRYPPPFGVECLPSGRKVFGPTGAALEKGGKRASRQTKMSRGFLATPPEGTKLCFAWVCTPASLTYDQQTIPLEIRAYPEATG